MKLRSILALLLTTSVAWAPAAADQPSVRRGEPQRQGNYWEERAECAAPMREGSRLLVRADFGSISVTPGPSAGLTCQVRLRVYNANEAEARRYFRSYELTLRPHEGGLYLKGSFPSERQRHRSLSAEFEIAVPLRSNLDLETKGGEIRVGKLQGSLEAVTAGGAINAADLTGPVRVETAGGAIVLGSVAAPVVARTAGGEIRVGDVKGDATLETSGGVISAGKVTGALRAETAGGDLLLRGATGTIEAQTAGGQIRIGDSGGNVIAQTAGGSIRLHGARGRVNVKTAGGNINLLQLRNAVNAMTAAGCIMAQIDADQKTFSASELATSAGDILVYLPPSLPITIDAAIDMAAGHKILSDFPLNIQGDGPAFAVTRLKGGGTLNGGGEVLRVRTVAGNIEIRRLDPATLERLRAQQESFWRRGEDND
jgi:hypothetical protein